MKTEAQYFAENMAIVGEAQPYATEGGEPPTGTPRNIEEYTPPERFLPPPASDILNRELEHRDGTYRLYGTPFTHARQQWYAIQHGRDSMGFDTTAVRFLVHFAYTEPRYMVVDNNGWKEI